jgi:peptide/nickel transport system ATP-binding protein
MTIEIDDLRIRFGEREVVKGSRSRSPRASSFGIVGESGSGKSTVLRAMAGLNHVWKAGSVFRQ